MKNFNLWFILALIAIFAMTCASQWNITYRNTAHSHTLHTAPTEHDTVKLADILLYTDRDGVMHFDTNKTKYLHGFTGDSIMFYYGYLFDVGEHNELRFESKTTTDYTYAGKITTYFYSLYHKGYYCKKVAANFDAKDNQLFSASINKFNLDVDTTIKIRKEEVIAIAKKNLDEKRYAWEEKGWENFATHPEPNLVIKEISKNNYRLAYEGYYTVLPLKTYIIHIDAENGEVISKNWSGGHCSGCQNCNNEVAHSGLTPLNYQNLTESIWIKQCSTSTGQCNKLKQTNHHKINFVSTLQGPPQDVCWETGSATPSDTILSLYWGVQTVYDYLLSSFSYHGFDSINTQPTNVLLDVGNNASFDISGAGLTLAFGTGIPPNKPWITLDAIGHEIAHGIDKKNVNLHSLPSYSEGLIIMEGFCDIVGIAVEATKKNTNDWAIQNDFTSNEIRYMNMPDSSLYQGSLSPQPKFYEGNNWFDTTVSNQRYIHHNNSVMNYWFYLLSNGTNGTFTNEVNQSFSFNGIGINSAFEVIFKTFTSEFRKSTYSIKDFQNLRKATMKVAENEYGCNNNVWNTVRQAWDAVGVTGSACEMAVNITTNCPSPSTCSANITTCGGSSTGTRIKITGGGLTSPIKSNTGQLNTTNLVCGNTYTVEVTDKNNPAECVVLKAFTCQDNAMGSITPPSPPCPIMTASYNVINNCNDKNDLTPLLPEGTYTYNWSNGSTSQNLTNVPSGTYSLTFTDVSNGCSYQESFNVIGLSEPTIIEHVTNLCNAGNQNGAINLMLFNTTAPPYTYQWSTGATTSSLNNLGQGTYNLTITDGNNCTHERSFYVAVKTPAIWGGFALPSCPLRTDGAITPNFVGGTAPYTFQWSNGKTTQNINNLSVGSYKLTITDANGCIASKTFNVTPETSYTFADNLGNCKRIYTCHGQTYSEDMLDYANIDYDDEECYSFTPCKLQGGSGLPTFGNKDWYLYADPGKGMKCKFICYINGTTIDVDPNLIATAQEAGSCNNGGTWIDFYCDGEFVEGRCDEYVKIGNPNPISVYPNPFVNKVSIKFMAQSTGITTLKLYNITGQEVWNKTTSTQIGENELIIQFDELSSGVYFLHLENSNGESYYHKLIHQ